MKDIDSTNQVFANVIADNLIYADKTKHVWELAKTKKAYFLSRPRRFGKSLLLSTIAALFKGPSDPEQNPQGLFKGLWISGEDASYDFNDTYPVIYISMSTANYSPEIVASDIQRKLRVVANSYGISLTDDSPQTMLNSLILDLKSKYYKNIVLLIDEYDDPVSSVISDIDLAKKNSDILRGFYSILKENQPNFRFVMLTGVTRYELLWQSGVLNHLFDLTMSKKRADICGFTYEEFDKCFADRFQITMEKFKEQGYLEENSGIAEFREAIFNKYDGYSWDGKTRVLNPFSLLNAFENEELISYWATLEPSTKILNAVMSKNPLGLTTDKLRNLSYDSIYSISDINSMTPIPALFQTGYLTIDKIITSKDNLYYSFKTPNNEIKTAFWKEFSSCLYKFLDFDIDKLDLKTDFIEAVIAEDSTKLSILIDSFFGAIPASLHIPQESYYHSVLYGYLNGLINIEALPEIPGADGTPDILCVIGDDLYVIVELKFKDPKTHPAKVSRKTKTAMEKLAISALETIDAKSYLRPYLAKAKKILKLGLGVYGRGRVMAILENEEQARARVKLMAKRSSGASFNITSPNTSSNK
ncbi:MAG: ATP-binding protein [Deltaproteobacteria bacterium]|nr:ATP-binding protein [Deltaproteobacteria bacterium]